MCIFDGLLGGPGLHKVLEPCQEVKIFDHETFQILKNFKYIIFQCKINLDTKLKRNIHIA